MSPHTEAHVSSSDTFCTFTFFDCFSTQAHKGVEADIKSYVTTRRETTVHDQQPHLVEPMKLTVYEQLPCTPLSAHHDITPRPFFSRAMSTSRASSRASFFSLKRMVSRQSMTVSNPRLVAQSDGELTLRRRRRDFRPLELSIYVDQHRLSDLPEFSRLSFTDFGELKNSDILSRPQSAALPPARGTQSFSVDENQKPASMFEIGSSPTNRPFTSYSESRPQTSYSVMSASRPPSEYDALHSHPVSWASLPGLSISTQNLKHEKPVAILTPMAEEFPSETTVVTVDGTVLSFPADQVQTDTTKIELEHPPIDLAAPAPVIKRGSLHGDHSIRSLDELTTSSLGGSRHGHKRSLSQWLATRSRSSSTSTMSSIAPSKSFAEHRRKRSQFYQLGHQARVSSISAPNSLNLGGGSVVHTTSSDPDVSHHQRSMTVSTIASTVDTDILTYGCHTNRNSQDTWSNAARTRSNTIKSVTSPTSESRKIVTPTVKELGLLTPMRGQVYIVDHDNDVSGGDVHPPPYLEEIGGPLRTPGVGVAF